MKKKLLFVYVLVAFMLLCTNVYAVITMDLSLVADNTSLKPGEYVEVKVNVKNISNSISSIEGYINVDEKVLNGISQDMVVNKDGKIEVKSGDTVIDTLNYVFNPTVTNADYDVIFNTKKENIENNDCFFIMDFKNDIKTNADVLTLKFKVKDDATIETVKNAVKVDCLVAYGANASDKSDSLSAVLDIKVEKPQENKEDDNKKDNTTNENTNKDDKNNNTTKDDNKVSENKNTNTNQNTNTNKNTNTNTNQNTNKNSDQNTNKDTNKNTNTNNTNTNQNKNTSNNSNVVGSANNTNSDGTISSTKLPATGAKMIVVPLVIFMILGYISYNKYIKYKDI